MKSLGSSHCLTLFLFGEQTRPLSVPLFLRAGQAEGLRALLRPVLHVSLFTRGEMDAWSGTRCLAHGPGWGWLLFSGPLQG